MKYIYQDKTRKELVELIESKNIVILSLTKTIRDSNLAKQKSKNE